MKEACHFSQISSYKMVRVSIRMVTGDILTRAGVLFYVMIFSKDSLRCVEPSRVNDLNSSYSR